MCLLWCLGQHQGLTYSNTRKKVSGMDIIKTIINAHVPFMYTMSQWLVLWVTRLFSLYYCIKMFQHVLLSYITLHTLPGFRKWHLFLTNVWWLSVIKLSPMCGGGVQLQFNYCTFTPMLYSLHILCYSFSVIYHLKTPSKGGMLQTYPLLSCVDTLIVLITICNYMYYKYV